ncbi:caspase-3-like [Cyprinodon tularosa]|uniref:caspase-3-like n=1 Tax=Cyprinodon tularosa TaxID=77115 RepID=UPI0018E24591|nr:caspase-3-like [Cyprinodon tularosa]
MEDVPDGDYTKDGNGDTVDALKWREKSSKQNAAEDTKMKRSSGSDAKPSDPYRYRMDYPCMGTCLVINNKNFDRSTGMSCRNGTDVDAGAVRKTFTNLGYKVKVLNDQSVDDMKKEIRKVAADDHSQNASFVCVLLSHGDEGVVYGTDGFEKFEDLIRCLKGDNCKSLVGKPKLLFIQACRGSALDDGCSIETDSVVDQTSERIPVEADFLYAYSTAPGYYSWRNTSNGSWFIQSLCKNLDKFSGQLELMQIMTRVNHHVALDFESASNLPGFDYKKQIPCIVSLLTKDFYFHNKQ